MKWKTIVISDLHLGTPESQPEKLLTFLEKNSCKKLILNGDIIDRRQLHFFGKRKAEYEHVLHKIKSICEKNQTELIYIQGNHERGYKEPTNILGKMHHNSTITSNSKSYLITHGDDFEKGMSKPNIAMIILFFIDTFFGRIDRSLKTNYTISHIMKHIYAFFTNQKTRFLKNAITYAKKNKVDGIICGHMHQAEIKTIDGIDYLNAGDRTESCSALVEDNKGNRKILYQD